MKNNLSAAGMLLIILTLAFAPLKWDFVGESYRELATLELPQDAESLIALGRRVKYSRADQYDLELIPGVASVRSARLLAARDEIKRVCGLYHRSERYKALEIIYGIGPETAKKIGRWLELDQCIGQNQAMRSWVFRNYERLAEIYQDHRPGTSDQALGEVEWYAQNLGDHSLGSNASRIERIDIAELRRVGVPLPPNARGIRSDKK